VKPYFFLVLVFVTTIILADPPGGSDQLIPALPCAQKATDTVKSAAETSMAEKFTPVKVKGKQMRSHASADTFYGFVVTLQNFAGKTHNYWVEASGTAEKCRIVSDVRNCSGGGVYCD
jgi:hypothetical protein